MFDLQKFNDLLGTQFASLDEITDHQLLAALVALTAASLGVKIFVCKSTTRPVDGAICPECGKPGFKIVCDFCSFPIHE